MRALASDLGRAAVGRALHIAAIRLHDPGVAQVGKLQQRIGVAASTLSHHLRHLREAGLVSQDEEVTLVWADGAIRNQWLRVTVKANGVGPCSRRAPSRSSASATLGRTPLVSSSHTDISSITLTTERTPSHTPSGSGRPSVRSKRR